MKSRSSPSSIRLSLGALFMIGASLFATAASTPPGEKLLVFVGSNTLGEHAVPELAKAYLEQKKKATDVKIVSNGELIHVTGTIPGTGPVYVEIHATGSGDSFKSFLGNFPRLKDPCDIGMSSRRVTNAEAEAVMEKLGSDFLNRGKEPGTGSEHPVALDGLAIVVHESNPLGRISFSEIKAIYSRKLTDWKDAREWGTFGGGEQGQPIIPLRRKEPSGTLDFFKQMIAPDAAAMADEKQIQAFVSSTELAKHTAEVPGAIGFIGESYANVPGLKRLQVYDDSPAMGMDADSAVFPDRAAVRMGIYPLSRFVFLYTREATINPEVKPFIEFALSEAGQTIIADKGNLVKIEGTHDHITKMDRTPAEATQPLLADAAAKRKTRIVLRISGSNTVGSVLAVNLAFNYFSIVTKDAKKSPPIEDHTIELETPEGEKALAHDVMCDVDSDGTWETISIRPTGSSDAFRDLARGACDVGMSSRPISGTEQRDLMTACGNLLDPEAQFALGLDGLAIIISPDNSLEKITVDDVRRVFLGEINNFSALGGPDRPIQLHARPERSGTYKFFSDAVLLGRSISGTAKRHSENTAVAESVVKDPNGIGFVPMTNAGSAKILKVGDSKASYAAPTEDTIRRGAYPSALCRYVYFYVPAAEPQTPSVPARRNWPIAREFAAMSQTWRGQAIVESSGFVAETSTLDATVKVRRSEGEPLTDYLRRLGEIESKVRSGTLKLQPKLTEDEICPQLLFDFNEWTLTAESTNLIDKKLASWLKMHPQIAKSGLVAEGWADSVGSEEACKKVSLKRARTVAEYISSSLGVKVSASGMGKSFNPPNNSEENKQKNRRVVIKRSPAAP